MKIDLMSVQINRKWEKRKETADFIHKFCEVLLIAIYYFMPVIGETVQCQDSKYNISCNGNGWPDNVDQLNGHYFTVEQFVINIPME